MKRTTLAGLFIAAAMLASPVFAADNNLCLLYTSDAADE